MLLKQVAILGVLYLCEIPLKGLKIDFLLPGNPGKSCLVTRDLTTNSVILVSLIGLFNNFFQCFEMSKVVNSFILLFTLENGRKVFKIAIHFLLNSSCSDRSIKVCPILCNYFAKHLKFDIKSDKKEQ